MLELLTSVTLLGADAAPHSAAMLAGIKLAYLLAAVLFILGLKGLAHPRTAVRGNFIGAIGMLIAIVATLLDHHVMGYVTIVAGLLIGSAIGVYMAQTTPMTAMPQMVGLLNGFGGLASVLVAFGELIVRLDPMIPKSTDPAFAVATAVSGIIGAVTFTGSMIAFAKLQELMSTGAIVLPARHAINLALLAVALGCGWWLAVDHQSNWAYVSFTLLSLASLALGVTLVLPIGGADMPVVIALLNSYSGLAAAATGFVVDNNVLIISGSLVGASGIILSQIMCKAMNRSLANVMFAVMATGQSGAKGDDVYAGKVKSATADEIAMILDGARRVVIVPGYGLAVAQAQHAVSELVRRLEKRGTEVEFGIHPVAGRMPGHMNVLLAEAEIPYDKLKDMDQINPTFAQTDVVLVLGANDVVNPLARTDPRSPIAGMPILDVDKAKTVIVVKRSLSPGFAGIPNPLFAAENALMFFADGKKAIADINTAVAELG